MAPNIIFILRIVQVLFAIIVLGLAAYVVSAYNGAYEGFGYTISLSRVNFMIFVSLWTLLVVTFVTLVSRFAASLAHPIILLAVDALTMLFWFAGFVALAVYVSAYDSVCISHTCDSIRAAAAFGAFEWLLFVATTVLGALNLRNGHSATKTTHHGGPGATV